jgi:ACS family hexuronate transporter-like MFS transporter
VNNEAPRARPASWKWWITGLLLLATMINYMDRQTLASASEEVKRELFQGQNLPYGNLELGFGWAFALGSLVFGFLADRVKVYLLYPAVLAGWSLMGIASGLSQGATSLLVCRIALGFFEAGHWPCALKTTFALLNEKERTMGNSILQGGASIGAIITPQIMRMMMTDAPGSWRGAFVAVGAAGLLWIVLWFACLRLRDLDHAPIAVGKIGGLDLLPILRSGKFWAVALMIIGAQTVWQLNRVWLISFLQDGRGYGRDSALNFSSFYYTATDIGCFMAGGISLWLVRSRGTTPHHARRTVYLGACMLTSLAVFIPWLGKGPLLLAVLLLIGAGALALFPCYYSFVQELSGKYVGRLTGLLSMWVWATTSPMHSAFGKYADGIADPAKRYNLGLVIAGLAPWIGVVALKFLWRKNETPPAI